MLRAGLIVTSVLSLAVGSAAFGIARAALTHPMYAAHSGAQARSSVAMSPFAVPADKESAGVWQSETQVLPTARCHPHCHLNNDGSGLGDPYNFSFSPHETPPSGYTYRYANPRFVSQWGNGCPFEVWNPFQANDGGATLTAWARSEPCYFTVALDRFAVKLAPKS
jgi:hypothetical protein